MLNQLLEIRSDIVDALNCKGCTSEHFDWLEKMYKKVQVAIDMIG